MAKRMLSLLLAVVMVLGMIPAMNLAASAEEAQSAPAPLWSEDFQSQEVGAYTGSNFAVVNHETGHDHCYNIDVEEEAGNKSLHITYNESLNLTAAERKYGFQINSTAFEKTNAMVVNFRVKFNSEMNVFQLRLFAAEGGNLFSLQLSSGTVTYSYSGADPWSGAMDVTTKKVTLSNNEWHDLQLVAIQRTGEGEKDYWALLENGQILIGHEGDYHFGNNAANTKHFGKLNMYVQSAGSGTVQMRDTWLDDLSVYTYTPATEAGFVNESYSVDPGQKVQTAVTMTPAVLYPAVKPVYTTGDAAIATVDEKGQVTGVAAGSTTVTATLTNLDGSVVTDTATVMVATVDPNLLWYEDFQDETAGQAYSEGKFKVKDNEAVHHFYNLDVAEESGDRYLHITYNEDAYNASFAETGNARKYGFYARSTAFTKTTNALVLNFSTKFSNEMNTFMVRALAADGSGLLSLLFSSGTITYSYTGTNPWSNAMTDITTKSVSISKDQWHDLQLVAIQRTGEGEKDYWALLENGEILIQLEGDHHFGNSAANTKSFGLVDFYVQSAGSGTVQINNTYFDDFAAYAYVPATGVTLDQDSYTLEAGQTAQAAATVAPAVQLPAVKVEYSVDNTAVAAVDAAGLITAVGSGATTLTAKVTNWDGTVVTDTATVTVESGEPAEPVDPNLLWAEDYEDWAAGAVTDWHGYTLTQRTSGKDPCYDFSVVEEEGNKRLHISYNETLGGAQKEKYGFYLNSPVFGPANAVVVDFSLKFDTQDIIQIGLLDDKGGVLIGFQVYRGTLTYTYDRASWSSSKTGNGMFQVENPSATLAANAWHNLQFVGIQRTGEGEKDAWMLLKDGEVILQHEGDYHFANNAGKTTGFGKIDIYEQTAGSGTVQVYNTYLDNFAVRTYVPATGVTLSKDSYALKAGETAQAVATVVPAVTVPAAKVEYSVDNTAVASVDANGVITGNAIGGTAILTAKITNFDGTVVTDTATVTVEPGEMDALWSEDFEDNTVGAITEWDKFTLTNRTPGVPPCYDFNIVEADGSKSLRITYNDTLGQQEKTKHGFYLTGTAFTASQIVEFDFRVKFSNGQKNTFQVRVLSEDGGVLIAFQIDNGTITYDYGGSKWSGSFDVMNPQAAIPGDQWNDLKFIGIQKTGDGEVDNWMLLCDGEVLLQHEGNYHFGNNAANKKGFGKVDIYVQSASSGTVQVHDTQFDHMTVRTYVPVPATAVTVPETMEAEIGRTTQLIATVTPADATLYKLSYTSADENIATVDQFGKVIGVTEGTTTITVTLTNANGEAVTDTVEVTVVPANPLIWEEDFEDEEIGSTGGFKVVNTNTELGSITVQDATGFGGNGNALVMDREFGGLFTLNGGFQLPTSATKMVLEYKLLNTDTSHQNTVLPTLAGAHNNGKRFLSLFINNGMLYWNNGEAVSVQALSSQEWYTIKLVIDTDEGVFQLYLNGKPVASEQKLLYGNTGPITHVYFQSSTSDDQTLGNGLWMDDFKVNIYTPIESLELLDETITLEGRSSAQIRVKTFPEEANGQVIYTSSDESIAVVDGNGVVTGVAPGEVTITAATFEGASDTMKVIVNEVKPTSITVDQTSLAMPVGAHTYINATVQPENAIINTVTMTSSDTDIVTVDEWGEVVCLKAGTAKLIFTAGDIRVEVPVTVSEADVMKTIQVSTTGTSIEAALAEIAAINATEAKMTGNIEVIVADGYYYFSNTLQMNELHGGTNGYSVIWKAAEGAKPVFGGALRIPGSSFTAGENGIYTIDLSTLGVPKVADPNTMSTTRQLFVNNIRATRARTDGGLTNCGYYKSGDTNLGHTSSDAYLADFARIKDLEFVYQELWTNPRAGVSEIIKNADGTVSFVMDQPGWRYATNKGASSAGAAGPVWIENALELLDQPGEWYLNEETQILYYMPRVWEDMSSVTVSLPLLESWDKDRDGISGLMHIAGTDYDNMVHNIHFEGITFADTTWNRPSSTNGHSDAQNNHLRENGDVMTEGSITVARANGICFTGCTFTRLGITAVKFMRGVQNSHFVGNHFYDLSAGAINIGEPTLADKDVSNPSDRRKMMKNDDILNNYIHNVAVDYNSSAAISLSWGPDMNFSYNEIFNMAYSGYHIGYGWTTKFENNLKNLVVSHNFIHDFMGDGVADGGGVYTIGNSGGDDNNYNQVCYNFVKTVKDDSGPLYMDNGATFYEVHHNVVDLSKVTDWSGNTSISWLQMNDGARKLKVHDNYATVKKYNYYATDSEIEDGHLEDPNNWSAEAKAIIDGAGLQSEYAHLRKGHAELIVTNLDTFADLKVGDSVQIQVSYTDGKDVPVSGGRYICAFDSKNPDVVEVSTDGKITALKSGKAVIRVWVVSNDILDVIEKTVYVEDTIEEVYLEGYKDIDTLSMSDASDGINMVVNMEMAQGRVMKPDAAFVSFAVADEAVAKIVDGVLMPVGVGSTTVTVRVDLGTSSGEVTYTVNIVAALKFQDDYLEDVFNSQKTDWVNSGVAIDWQQVPGESLTVKTGTWTTFGSRTYGNELLTFKLKLDTTTTGGWPCFVIRADSATVNTAGGGASGYVLCFGKGEKGIELQRWNGQTRTMIIGNLTGFDPTSGIRQMLHNVDDGNEHIIQFGAVTDGGTTRLALWIDGVKYFDFLDDDPNAITAPGYFGIIGRKEGFYLSKTNAEEANKEASVGNTVYSSAAEAIAAAKPGETVKLLRDAEVNGVLVKEGVSVDLNGNELTADYLVAFADSQVIDSVGGGLLKSRNVRLAADNAQMPVWVEADGGYRFFTMKDSQLYLSQSESGFVFIAKPVLGKAANAPFMALANYGLSVKARMSWKSAAGNDVEQFFVLKGEDVQKIYSDTNQIIQLTVNGAGAYIGRLSTTMVIESETGVIWAGVPLLYTGN